VPENPALALAPPCPKGGAGASPKAGRRFAGKLGAELPAVFLSILTTGKFGAQRRPEPWAPKKNFFKIRAGFSGTIF